MTTTDKIRAENAPSCDECGANAVPVKPEITRLREVMKAHGIDGYIVPTTDFHGSEYVNDYFKCRKYLSNFTGSHGTLLITQDDARLWTDSRYFIQAPKQLEGTGISLMKCLTPGYPELEDYLPQIADENFVLGFDGRVVSLRDGEKYAAACKVKYDVDLVDLIWEDRPAIKASKVYALPESLTGESYTAKLARVQAALADAGIDYHLTTSLEEIAWLFNLRGDDIPYTPVFFAFALISPTWARLYLLDDTFAGLEGVTTLPYLQVFEDLKELEALEADASSATDASVADWKTLEIAESPDRKRILLNARAASYALIKAIPESVEIVNAPSPIELMKAQKNAVEIAATKAAQVEDGVAMTNFIYWLKHEAFGGRAGGAGGANANAAPTELSTCEYLEGCRRARPSCIDLSFETMAGYGINGASIHYDTNMGHPCPLSPRGFLLVDSGGQYMDGKTICGTTDVTRTISLGPLTQEEKEHYTMVLKSYLALANAKFETETHGSELDDIAKSVLREAGLPVYNYDTGHGVGHLLSVHEGPRMIGPTDNPMLPGMMVSNEPGIYIEGSHGIRIENELLVVDAGSGNRKFEQISWIPMDRAAILPEMLTVEERVWLNTYHAEVYDKLSAHLDEPVRAWLAEETAEI